jgi:hypothetical protein
MSQEKEKSWGSLAAVKEEAASFSVTYQVITQLTYTLTYLLPYLLTYILHEAESFLGS